jgi:hypothetical protein
MASLDRLARAGLVEHAGRGEWTVVGHDLESSERSAPKPWIAPLSGRHTARHAAEGRVRDELTMALDATLGQTTSEGSCLLQWRSGLSI